MLVTPFVLVTPWFVVNRYGPLVSVIVPWHILQASSKLAATTKSSYGSPPDRGTPGREPWLLTPASGTSCRRSKTLWRSSQPLTTEPS
jgi:hypothetical protein